MAQHMVTGFMDGEAWFERLQELAGNCNGLRNSSLAVKRKAKRPNSSLALPDLRICFEYGLLILISNLIQKTNVASTRHHLISQHLGSRGKYNTILTLLLSCPSSVYITKQ